MPSICIADFDYNAPDGGHFVSFSAGDTIINVLLLDGGWWYGTNARGEQGYFPASFVSLHSDNMENSEHVNGDNESRVEDTSLGQTAHVACNGTSERIAEPPPETNTENTVKGWLIYGEIII